jgi:hypothetical protein
LAFGSQSRSRPEDGPMPCRPVHKNKMGTTKTEQSSRLGMSRLRAG